VATGQTRRRAGLPFVLLVVWLALPVGKAVAQVPLMLGIEPGLSVPVSEPQSQRFGVGGSLGVALHVPFLPFLVPLVRVRAGFLSDGPAPAERTLRDPGVGSQLELGAALRLRPLAFGNPEAPQRAASAWVEVAVGGALTGPLVRPEFELGLGYAFEVDALRIGPSARLTHIVHFDDPIDSRSAWIVTLGAEIVLFDAGTVTVVAPPPPDVPDTDGDGLRDPDDACPSEPEDVDAFEDEDGCPEPDNDRDGILDLEDRCPLDAEDADGFEDGDGCPELDNDRDGILDDPDHCPDEPEVINGIEDDDGCPDRGLITMVDDRIVLEETVLFDFERARVKSSARPVLAAIVMLWSLHPEWAQVRVEGHADARGDAAFNQELSERRAAHVRDALVELGMPTGMIEVRGFGASQPRDTRQTEVGFQRNRRVEFVVTERRAVAVEGE